MLVLRSFAPKPERYPHTSVIPQCVHNNLLSLSTYPQSSVRSQSIRYSHVSIDWYQPCCMTGVCGCVHFTFPLSHTFFLPEWPRATSPHGECCFVPCSEVVSLCQQMEDEDAGRKSKQQNGGVYEDSKHKKVERTQRWVTSHRMPLSVSGWDQHVH